MMADNFIKEYFGHPWGCNFDRGGYEVDHLAALVHYSDTCIFSIPGTGQPSDQVQSDLVPSSWWNRYGSSQSLFQLITRLIALA